VVLFIIYRHAQSSCVYALPLHDALPICSLALVATTGALASVRKRDPRSCCTMRRPKPSCPAPCATITVTPRGPSCRTAWRSSSNKGSAVRTAVSTSGRCSAKGCGRPPLNACRCALWKPASAMAATPYTVSVGNATSPPSRSSLAASSTWSAVRMGAAMSDLLLPGDALVALALALCHGEAPPQQPAPAQEAVRKVGRPGYHVHQHQRGKRETPVVAENHHAGEEYQEHHHGAQALLARHQPVEQVYVADARDHHDADEQAHHGESKTQNPGPGLRAEARKRVVQPAQRQHEAGDAGRRGRRGQT